MTKKTIETKLTLLPLNDRVLVLPDVEKEIVTTSGFIVQNSTANIKGIVTAVGEGKTLEDGTVFKTKVSIGDTVLLGQYGHEIISFDGVGYYLVQGDSILAIIKNN